MLTDLLESLRGDPEFMASVTHWEVIAPRPASFADFPGDLDQRIAASLRDAGIERLYTHQRASYAHVRNGDNVVIVTPTASGKTLAYNLPVLQSMLENPDARAIYLFPTKALSQDQQAELNDVLIGGQLPLRIFTFDGDTPSSIRISAREQGRVIITNPDMLHAGILPNHPKWIRILKSLKYVVIDEIHTYRGVFGSHMTNLMRRLTRIAAFYGSKPVFICCSATIGNPLELSQRIIEQQAVLIDENGSPSGERHFVFYNPPLVDRVQGIRRGVVREAQKIATRLLKAQVKTIVFSRSRLRTELIASYIVNALHSYYTDDHGIRIASYRGGYLPGERRQIEQGLRDGSIMGVVSTNALELGIDIGGLDASVLAGFPGSIAAAWQQAGRAGRRQNLSLSILVASASPIDQYIIKHPQYFFGKSPESGWVDPNNVYILVDQMKCAVFELPFDHGAGFGAGPDEVLAHLEENGVVRHTGGRWFWSDRSYPAEKVSIRTSSAENVVIVDTTANRNIVIGEIDKPSAKLLVFDGAIYIHRGAQYVVRQLDLENSRCYIEESRENYFTDSIVKTDIQVLHSDEARSESGFVFVIGDVLVRNQTTKFKKIKFQTHENVGYGDINLPAEEMHTRSIVLTLADGSAAGEVFRSFGGEDQGIVVHKLGFLIKNVAPLFLLCDPRDIGVAERLKDPFFGCPALYVYDNYPGGSGLSEGFLEQTESIVGGALELVSSCACRAGCPSCIGPPEQPIGGNPKQLVTRFLRHIAPQ